ncbi:hypothetical protein BDZ89DRAFT_1133633 [Hymenopellis radicata]|nr:hypothetical protein BDZ89DRAFT_1133633 [Hymenopellis radicata]
MTQERLATFHNLDCETLNFPSKISSLSFASTGRHLAVSHGKTLALVKRRTHQIIFNVADVHEISCVSWLNAYIAMFGTADGGIRLIGFQEQDNDNALSVLVSAFDAFHHQEVVAMSVTRDGRYLAASNGLCVQTWICGSGTIPQNPWKLHKVFDFTKNTGGMASSVKSVSWSPSGSVLYALSSHHVLYAFFSVLETQLSEEL